MRPCDPFVETTVRHRTEGTSVVVEAQRSRGGCREPVTTTSTPLARIRLSSTPSSSCPIGQVGLRSLTGGHGFEKSLPAFVASLEQESLAEVSQALMSFADAAEAFVIACPSPGHADWLFVETNARGEAPLVQLFIANRLSSARAHPRVTLLR